MDSWDSLLLSKGMELAGRLELDGAIVEIRWPFETSASVDGLPILELGSGMTRGSEP